MYGFSQSTSMGVDSILLARQVVSEFQYVLADSTMLMANGTINHDTVSITFKKRSVKVEYF